MQTAVFAGDIMAMPPFGAWLRTGIRICAQPELNVPITATTFSLPAYAWAFWLHLPESHFAACAVASSHDWNATLWSPAFQSCWSSRYRIAPTIWIVCVRLEPWSGRSGGDQKIRIAFALVLETGAR